MKLLLLVALFVLETVSAATKGMLLFCLVEIQRHFAKGESEKKS
jgi:hypothetical protein